MGKAGRGAGRPRWRARPDTARSDAAAAEERRGQLCMGQLGGEQGEAGSCHQAVAGPGHPM